VKEKDIVSNDIALTFDFIRFAIKNPRILQQIPNGYDIRLLTKEFLKKEIDDETRKQ
jgi:hypothetical protein